MYILTEPTSEYVCGENWDKTNLQWQARYSYIRRCGIEIQEPEGDTIRVIQTEIPKGRIYTQKELYKLARDLYPSKQYKIKVLTFPLDSSLVTSEWVREQMELYGIKPKDLSQQLGFTQAAISELINGKRPLSSPVRASLFYYFLVHRINIERTRESVKAEDLIKAIELVRSERLTQ